MTDIEKLSLKVRINSSFTPSAPIDSADLFAGRSKQIDRVMGAVFQRGQHAIIFGERGVGKTSLSNIIFDILVLSGKSGYQTARYTSGAESTFDTMWKSIFKQLTVMRDTELSLVDMLPESPSPQDVKDTMQLMDAASIIIVDEFDRVEDDATGVLLADTIKTLSDNSIDTTLILVGVADSVEQLISEHQSIERALVQIQMPRMSHGELQETIDKGLRHAEMTMDAATKKRIADLSQGLPHYTHLLARFSALESAESGRTNIEDSDLSEAIKESVLGYSQSVVSAYHKATQSPRENLYKEVLLSAALAEKDELGFFSAGDLREPMQRVTNKRYEIPAYSRHLYDFCEDSRGKILQKLGETKRFRFRFTSPLMEPFVVLKGVSDGLIPSAKI
jgi:Cdc6-like AAA superfamily ATPase